jgi:hypothetical protein
MKNLKSATLLGAAGALIMFALEFAFYASGNKTAMRPWVNTIAFPWMQLGARIFSGAPLTRTTDILFNSYLVACLAFEGFLIGLCIDVIRARWQRDAATMG